MPTNAESLALQTYISEVIIATRDGKINWKAVNPTTFVWETGLPQSARIILQRVERFVTYPLPRIGTAPQQMGQKKELVHIFQAFDLKSSVLTLDSSVETQFNDLLSALFDLVQTRLSEKTLDFLKSTLPK
jgi:hypothetical protein